MKIEAKIIAHSKSSVTGKEIVTWELQYPRFIHSEFMTHRLFSRNAASSRAIPVAKMLEMVREHPAMPVRFGANQAGMQDKGVEHTELVYIEELFYMAELNGMDEDRAELFASINAKSAWRFAANKAAATAEAFSKAGYHKQIANRLTEPFQWMKTVMTATELDNWFWLRDHVDADPTIAALAHLMWEVLQNSTPRMLNAGEWHLPYVASYRDFGGGFIYAQESNNQNKESWFDVDTNTWMEEISLEDALAISSSCCAQVSYRKLDDSLEKAKDIFDKLIHSKPCHASPTEHQCTPMAYAKFKQPLGIVDWENGVTHMDKNGDFWSGNFKGFIQHRQLITDNVCNNYVPSTKEGK